MRLAHGQRRSRRCRPRRPGCRCRRARPHRRRPTSWPGSRRGRRPRRRAGPSASRRSRSRMSELVSETPEQAGFVARHREEARRRSSASVRSRIGGDTRIDVARAGAHRQAGDRRVAHAGVEAPAFEAPPRGWRRCRGGRARCGRARQVAPAVFAKALPSGRHTTARGSRSAAGPSRRSGAGSAAASRRAASWRERRCRSSRPAASCGWRWPIVSISAISIGRWSGSIGSMRRSSSSSAERDAFGLLTWLMP